MANLAEKGLLPTPPPLPPRPSPRVQAADPKQPVAQRPRHPTFPTTKKGRILLASIILLALIVIIVAICASVLPKRNTGVISETPHDGGIPLPINKGGVDIGRPGDIAKFGNASGDHIVLVSFRSSFVTRLDPIVNPGQLGSHVHRVHGSSYFTPQLISAPEAQKLANCSTTPIQDDKSLYWVPELYYQHTNKTLSTVPLNRHNVYYFFKAPTGVPIYPFPDNYNMVVGNPNRRFSNASDPWVISR